MNGGFKTSRYGTTKWEEIQAAAKKDAKKSRTAKDIRELVKDPLVVDNDIRDNGYTAPQTS